MVAEFLAGLIVGVLLGLTLAPILRSWILWQVVRQWRDPPTDADREATEVLGDAEERRPLAQ
jgi:hypothetical protein